MQRFILSFSIILFSFVLKAQNNDLWSKVHNSTQRTYNTNIAAIEGNVIPVFRLNEDLLKKKLAGLNDTEATLEITFPNSKGDFEVFMVKEASNFEPELQAKYPEIRAYSGVGITDKKASLCFSFCPTGLQTSVFRPDNLSEFMQPSQTSSSLYTLTTNKTKGRASLPINCTTDETQLKQSLYSRVEKLALNDKTFRSFRLALSCTGEYAAYFGGTKAGALAGMNATMTRVNGVFNKDLALKLVIIAGDESVIFTDPATDPYSGGEAGSTGAWSQELQTTLTNIIKNSGYDIGHLFGASGGGGNAGCVGCVCVNPTTLKFGKGAAYTSPSDNTPEGDRFDVDYVCHEMGHQLGAYHTFSFIIEDTGSNVEPGSGNTIMGYAGIADQYDIQAGSDDYFSYQSIEDIRSNLIRKTCQTSTAITNNPPAVSAGPSYSIPRGTPFILKGSGLDPEGSTLTYTWEESDVATTSDGENSFAVSTKLDGPLFRSLPPTNSPVRYLPALSSVLANRLTNPWESVSAVPRTLNFTLTARDNAITGTAQTNYSRTSIIVTNTGPFEITSQATQDIGWIPGSSQNISWNENGTSSLSGSSNVNIKLSTDGGATFPIVLATNIANNGKAVVTAPTGISSTTCRLLLEPVNNIFYAVNKEAFSIGLNTSTACNTYIVGTSYTFPQTTTSNNTITSRRVFVPTTTNLISNLDFQVNLSFTDPMNRFPELEFELVSPKGTKAKLSRADCKYNSNLSLDLVFDDNLGTSIICDATSQQTIKPFDALSIFNGENQGGTWTFNIYDYDSKSGTGTINSASITICGKTQVTLSKPGFETNDFLMYPNPNKGSFNITFTSKSSSGVQIYVNDILGRKVFEKNYESKNLFNENIELHNVFSGLYLITIVDGEQKMTKKLIIE